MEMKAINGLATASSTQGAATASGFRGAAIASGKHGVALGIGEESRARAGDGCALVLVERGSRGEILNVFAGVAGRRVVKADAWYMPRGGRLVETQARRDRNDDDAYFNDAYRRGL